MPYLINLLNQRDFRNFRGLGLEPLKRNWAGLIWAKLCLQFRIFCAIEPLDLIF
jgi:hypothetical protein